MPVPPLAEQRRIADILDCADAMRAKRLEAIALIDGSVARLFVEMFGDGEDDRWPEVPVSAWVDRFETGKSVDPVEDEDALNRVLKVSAVTSLEFLAFESKPVDNAYKPPREHFVRRGDLLFSRANTRELIGATALVQQDADNLLLSDKLWRFVWREPRQVDPRFVQALFRTRGVRREIGQRATGTSGSMKNISQEKVLSLRAMLPPLELQRVFASRVDAIDRLKASQRGSLIEMDALFASLQHRAFHGEL